MEEEWMRPTRGSLSLETGQDDDAYDNWISTLNASSGGPDALQGLPITESKTPGVTSMVHGYSQSSSPVLSRIPSMDHSQRTMDRMPTSGTSVDSNSGLYHVFLGRRPLSNTTPSQGPLLTTISDAEVISLHSPLHEPTATVDNEGLPEKLQPHTDEVEASEEPTWSNSQMASTYTLQFNPSSNRRETSQDERGRSSIHAVHDDRDIIGTRQESVPEDVPSAAGSPIAYKEEHGALDAAEGSESDRNEPDLMSYRQTDSPGNHDFELRNTMHVDASEVEGQEGSALFRKDVLPSVKDDNFDPPEPTKATQNGAEKILLDESQDMEGWISSENVEQPAQESQDYAVAPHLPETNAVAELWGRIAEDAEPLEDDWSNAIGQDSTTSGGGWDALMADDDEDFLDDEGDDALLEYTPLPANPPTTSRQPTNQITAATRPTSSSRNYSPIVPAIPVQTDAPSTKPMEFFAELPSARVVRSKKPPQPPQTMLPPPPPPQPTTLPTISHALPNSAPLNPALPPALRAPAPLEMFPPQSTAPSVPSPLIVPPLQTNLPAPSRYSPVINPSSTNPAIPQSYAPRQPSTSSITAQLSRMNAASYSSMESQPYPQPSTMSRPVSRQSSYQQPAQLAAQSTVPESAAPITRQVSSKYTPQAQAQPLGVSYVQPPAAIPPRQPSMTAAVAPQVPNRFAPRTSSPLAQPDSRPLLDRSATAPVPRQAALMDSTATGLLMQSKGRPGAIQEMAPYTGSDAFNNRQAMQLVENESMPIRPRTQSPDLKRTLTSRPYAMNADSEALLRTGMVKTSANNSHGPDLDNSRYAFPQDETAHDSLMRWKGSPLLRFGANGSVLTMFPLRHPRYGGGHASPMLICSAGTPKVRKSTDILDQDDEFASFPGPLKSKTKKKELLAWMDGKIAKLQNETTSASSIAAVESGPSPGSEEKTLLWHVMRLIVEHDGAVSGNQALASAIANKLVEMSSSISSNRRLTASNEGLRAEATTSSESADQADSISPSVVDEIKQNLLRGESEKAVWLGADNRLWAHAMLIASTMPGDIWKRVAQEFVRKEVRRGRPENKSMAALYEVFAGNWEESIDQLVPPSARAGLQFISTKQSGASVEDTQEGLNRWTETLALILRNRSKDDEQAIAALGKLLATYGRIEAAHICFLLSRSVATFGGADDAQSVFSLLGSQLNEATSSSALHLDSILLSEIYEFALSLTPSASTSYYVPHLQSYKLYHAYALTELGQRKEAIQYCEAIASAMKASTRASQYYHTTLAAQIDDLSKRLAQTPKDSSSTWISKPSIEKVSGSMWAKFNSFVAGDDTDEAANGAGKNVDDPGPFAKLSGGTPTISRSPSTVDLYGSNDINRIPSQGTVNSRYAPAAYGVQAQSAFEPSRPIMPSFGSNYPFQTPMEPIANSRKSSYGMPVIPATTSLSSSPSRFVHDMSNRGGNEQGSPSSTSTTFQSYAPATNQYTVPEYGASSSTVPSTGIRDSGLSQQSQYMPYQNDEQRSAHGRYAASSDTYPPRASGGDAASYSQHSQSSYAPTYNETSLEQDDRGKVITYQTMGDVNPFQPSDDTEQLDSATTQAFPSQSYQPQTSEYEPPPQDYSYEPPSNNFEEPTTDYEPLSDIAEPYPVENGAASTGGYAPPSYQPYMPDAAPAMEDDKNVDVPKPKKKSFMDDDEDDELVRKAAALKLEEKSRNDAAADEAFRKAAEADGTSSNPPHPLFPAPATDKFHSSARRRGRQEKGRLARRLVRRQKGRRRRAAGAPRKARRGELLLLRHGDEEVGQQKGRRRRARTRRGRVGRRPASA